MTQESHNMKPDLTDEWQTYMQIDAMYFHAARQAHTRAKEQISEIKKAKDNWESLEQEYDSILSKHDEDSYSAYDELEPIAIQMEDAHYIIGEAHGPLL